MTGDGDGGDLTSDEIVSDFTCVGVVLVEPAFQFWLLSCECSPGVRQREISDVETCSVLYK